MLGSLAAHNMFEKYFAEIEAIVGTRASSGGPEIFLKVVVIYINGQTLSTLHVLMCTTTAWDKFRFPFTTI